MCQPSSALICSTSGASSSEYSGSDRISAFVTTALRSTRSLPSQPLLSWRVVPLVGGGTPGEVVGGSIVREVVRFLDDTE
jgi:hypothetical protein